MNHELERRTAEPRTPNPIEVAAADPARHRHRRHRGRSDDRARRARCVRGTSRRDVARSVCPYCAVGCGQLIFHDDGKLVSIEGDPESPISEGHLCPKGAATLRAPDPRRAGDAGEVPRAGRDGLDRARSRDRDGHGGRARVGVARARTSRTARSRRRRLPLMQCTSIAHLGGATLDNEENYLIKKLFTGGLGMVAISNQARI